ncbi:MAG: glycoside hydrolase family 16 protein [Bacteroidota bacterium]|nr:glycoside hydrolase family 16 protein [Bacteroidota bacterium]
MRIISLMITLLVLLVSCKSSMKLVKTNSENKLVWSDEFNYTGLPDPAKWNYEEGFVRNHEQQYYTKARLENARVEDGMLVITSLKEDYKNAHYTSASLNTSGRQSFNGDIRVEVRAKLPDGKGIWPAIWMLGTNEANIGWPRCSELDIMEYVGHTPNTVFGTFHWWDSTASNNHHSSKGSKLIYNDLHSNFHVYGLERRGNQVKLFVDNHFYLTFTPPTTAYPGSFANPLYLLINTALGGSWGKEIDDTIFPQKFYIDYVRVYSLAK